VSIVAKMEGKNFILSLVLSVGQPTLCLNSGIQATKNRLEKALILISENLQPPFLYLLP